jgi:hypothetical protein
MSDDRADSARLVWRSAGEIGLYEDAEPEPWERTAPAPPRSDRRDKSDHDDDQLFFQAVPRVQSPGGT